MPFHGLGIKVPYNSSIVSSATLPFNYMSFSEDPTKFNYLTSGGGAAIPHVFSAGASITVATKQQVPDIPGGEAGTGFTTTGLCQDHDSTDWWIGNFGNSRGSGGTQTPISAVRVSANGSTLITQVALTQAVGGLQGLAAVTASGQKYLAYVDGSSRQVCFVNRDGTIPRAPLPLSFVANALTWDNGRQALVVGDANSGDVWWMTLSGVLLFGADFNGWGGPIDHVTIDATRGTGSYLWAMTGANGSPGTLIAWDIAKDQLVNRWTLSDAQAPEGIALTNGGATLNIVSDGYYHSSGSLPNTVAPYNVNEFQTYTLPAVTQFRYARVWKAGELAGPFGARPYHMLLDRGDVDLTTDYCIVTRDADASINGQTAILQWSVKTFDGTTQNVGLRLLSGAAFTSRAVTGVYSRPNVSNTFASGANNSQIGTRGTQTADRVLNLVGSALAVNLGSTPVAYRPRAA